MEKLTAIIPTFNEEHNIVEAIKSVDFADEIIVVDSFSTDKTVELATPLATKVIKREYINSASQKTGLFLRLNTVGFFYLMLMKG